MAAVSITVISAAAEAYEVSKCKQGINVLSLQSLKHLSYETTPDNKSIQLRKTNLFENDLS